MFYKLIEINWILFSTFSRYIAIVILYKTLIQNLEKDKVLCNSYGCKRKNSILVGLKIKEGLGLQKEFKSFKPDNGCISDNIPSID